jgi:hypothetical protein
MVAAEVFDAITDRFRRRTKAIAVFLESGGCFEPWCIWEAFAAFREQGWSANPNPSYAEVGLLGSRETADLLVGSPGDGRRVVVELALVNDWSTNRWIASVDRDTRNLSRTLPSGTQALQVILAASHEAHVEANPTWRSWLEMTKIWPIPTDLTDAIGIGDAGQMVIRGWLLGG